ncbi:MAG: response regulator transcription factor [Elusimicrobiota bacterium]
MKILIVDKRTLIRSALVSLLEQIKKISIVGQTDNIDECLVLCKKFSPDIVIVGDVESSILTENITQLVKRRFASMKVLIISSEERDMLLDDFTSGADGYISNKWTTTELKNALGYFQKEGVLIPRKMAVRLVKELKEKSIFPKPVFTPMEKSILKLLAQGKLNKEIASILGKNEKIIKNYLHIIYIKLGVSRRAEAIARIFARPKDI